jgi:site-specific recombinase XerD
LSKKESKRKSVFYKSWGWSATIENKTREFMANLTAKTKENPKLQQNILADGRVSLYLDYYLGYSQHVDKETGKAKIKHNRKKEALNLYLIGQPRTQPERQKNKETLELAAKIREEREQEFRENKHGYRLKKERSINFLDYYQSYIDHYTKKDLRNIKGALERFKAFLTEKYPTMQQYIKPDQINKDMMSGFVEYLEQHSKGVGAWSYYQRFKKVVHYATEHGIFAKNPCMGIRCKVDDTALRKDVLSVEEIELLISTGYPEQNKEVKRAFIFCLYTGLRFCDVVNLKYTNVDYSNKMLKFEQSKTKGHSAASGVIIPLNDGLLSLIGTPPLDEDNSPVMDSNIFTLPSHAACTKALKYWTKRAGITKHITWHCGRHSFAVNILNNGANIKTVASLLGHSGLKHTEKYTRAVDSLKEAAINSLPALNFM